MGNFIGHAGGFIILAAVVMLFGAFLTESGIVKDRNKLILNGKVAAMTAVIGIIYYFIIGYIVNILRGQINIFDFNAIFGFKGITEMLAAYENPAAASGIKGMPVPFFAGTVNKLGGLVFKQYGGTAVWLNFAAVCGGMCCLYNMACDFFKKEISPSIILYIFALPYTFLLFTPGYWGVSLGLAAMAAYGFYKKNYILYGILTILAVLMSLSGLAALIVPIAGFSGIGEYIKKLPQSRIAANPYIRSGLLYVMFILNTVIMFRVIGG